MNNNNSTEYVLTNKKEFLEWFNKNFIQYRATGKQELMKKNMNHIIIKNY